MQRTGDGGCMTTAIAGIWIGTARIPLFSARIEDATLEGFAHLEGLNLQLGLA